MYFRARPTGTGVIHLVFNWAAASRQAACQQLSLVAASACPSPWGWRSERRRQCGAECVLDGLAEAQQCALAEGATHKSKADGQAGGEPGGDGEQRVARDGRSLRGRGHMVEVGAVAVDEVRFPGRPEAWRDKAVHLAVL